MSNPNTKESLLTHTVMDGGCWLYQGAPHGSTGHCKVRWDGKKVYIHRVSAHLHWGFDLNSPTLILHKVACSHPNCWNPEHLYEGTHRDNAADMKLTGTYKNVIAERESAKTHCPHGHPLDGMTNRGKRYCLTCNRLRAANV